MSHTLTFEYTVPSTAINAAFQVQLSFLQQAMQDAASRHAEQLGVGHRILEEQGRTFMLSRLMLALHADGPQAGERFFLDTWPRGVERLLAMRDFVGRDSSGGVFLTGATGWLVVDTRKMKIDRPQELLAGVKSCAVSALIEEISLPVWREDAPIIDERRIRFSDLDINQHVNNTRYSDWICDAVADDFGTQFRIREIAVSFINQLKLGERVQVSRLNEGSGRYTVQGFSTHRNFCASLWVEPV